MKNKSIAFIGAGNMAASLIGGLIKGGYDASLITASNPDKAILEQLQARFGIRGTGDNIQAIKGADVVVLCLKPQVMKSVVLELKAALLQQKPLILSIAAGVRVSNIVAWLGIELPVARAMPNTPAMLGAGATGLFANAKVTNQMREMAESIMRTVGVTVWVEDEDLMDVVTALSGSGPAYFFLVMENLMQASMELGLDKDSATLLTIQTALGAARMALESDQSITDLREQVTSPGGTTAAALKVLQERGMAEILKNALENAVLRAKELGKLD